MDMCYFTGPLIDIIEHNKIAEKWTKDIYSYMDANITEGKSSYLDWLLQLLVDMS